MKTKVVNNEIKIIPDCHIYECQKSTENYIVLRDSMEGRTIVCKACVAKMLKAKSGTIFDV